MPGKLIQKSKDKLFAKDGQVLSLANKFTYNVDFFKCDLNSYSLFDSKTLTSSEYMKEGTEHLKELGAEPTITRHLELISAPITWLKEKGFKEIND